MFRAISQMDADVEPTGMYLQRVLNIMYLSLPF